jgi:TRAP-type uncharacterized transport system fused permease subunit
MDATHRLRNHGSHLMSLASAGQLACLVLLIWNLSVRHWSPEYAAALADPEAWWMFVCFTSLVWLAQTWTLSRLRAIGKLLYNGEGISHAMARGWRRFGTALVVVAILTALPMAPRVDDTASGLHLVLGLDAGGLYFVVIGCLCIFSIAHLLEQATTLREDSESIV